MSPGAIFGEKQEVLLVRLARVTGARRDLDFLLRDVLALASLRHPCQREIRLEVGKGPLEWV